MTVVRLLVRGELRRGAGSHLAVVAMLAGVACALTLAAVIGRLASAPWERTWQATGAPHLTLFAPSLDALPSVPEATETSGPLATGFVGLRAGGHHVETRLQERPPDGPGRAALVEGRDDGGLLLERSFARSLGVQPGDTIAFDAPSGRTEVRVSGIAVTSDQEPYPFGLPGLSFGSRALLDAVIAPSAPRFAMEYIRVHDPAAAPAIEARLSAPRDGPQRREAGAQSWQDQRADVGERQLSVKIALELLSALLVLCAAPIVATLVSERILARGREFAILRAGGLTPGAIVTMTGLLYGALGLLGGLLGLAAGTLLAPLVTARSEELLAAPGLVGPAPSAAVIVALGTALLAALAAALPAWLLSRRPVPAALVMATGGGRRRPSWLARAARAARLPVPAVIGTGDAFARRARALLAILALALSVAALIGAVAMEMNFDERGTAPPPGVPMTTAYNGGEPFDTVTSGDDEVERLRGIAYPGVAMLLALGLANLVAVLALALREGRHETGILRAVGLTPGDTAWMVISRQLTLAFCAAVLGVPMGLALWWTGIQMGDASDMTYPPPSALAAAALAAVAASTLVTVPLARRAARLPVATVLRQD